MRIAVKSASDRDIETLRTLINKNDQCTMSVGVGTLYRVSNKLFHAIVCSYKTENTKISIPPIHLSQSLIVREGFNRNL